MPSAAADPAYLAYLRSVGVEESAVQNVANQRVSSLTRQMARQLPYYAQQRSQAIEGVGNSWEDRGMYRSGNRIVKQADAGREVDRQRNEYTTGVQDEIGGIYLTTAADIAARRRALAEQGINSAQTVALNNANSGIY
jgi:hypothetical protein